MHIVVEMIMCLNIKFKNLVCKAKTKHASLYFFYFKRMFCFFGAWFRAELNIPLILLHSEESKVEMLLHFFCLTSGNALKNIHSFQQGSL